MTTASSTPAVTRQSYSYREYREMIDRLLSNGMTTGTNHSQAYLDYTKMNVQRMKRHEKTDTLSAGLKEAVIAIQKPQYWILLTEAWCGDAAQTVPFIAKIAEQSSLIHLDVILRDENLDIMDRFLTDAVSRSIPKLVIYQADVALDLDGYLECDPIAVWGPRPASLQTLYKAWIREEGIEFTEIAERIHKWYADDKNAEIDAEFTHLLSALV